MLLILFISEMTQVLKSIPDIQKSAVYKMAHLHLLDHDSGKGANGYKLKQF